jgi:hypothetical protein
MEEFFKFVFHSYLPFFSCILFLCCLVFFTFAFANMIGSIHKEFILI